MTVRIPMEGKLVCHSQHNFNVLMIFVWAVHLSAIWIWTYPHQLGLQKLRAFHMFNYQLHGCVLFLSGSRPSIYCRVLFSVRLPAPGIEPGSSSSRGASLSYYAMAAGPWIWRIWLSLFNILAFLFFFVFVATEAESRADGCYRILSHQVNVSRHTFLSPYCYRSTANTFGFTGKPLKRILKSALARKRSWPARKVVTFRRGQSLRVNP